MYVYMKMSLGSTCEWLVSCVVLYCIYACIYEYVMEKDANAMVYLYDSHLVMCMIISKPCSVYVYTYMCTIMICVYIRMHICMWRMSIYIYDIWPHTVMHMCASRKVHVCLCMYVCVRICVRMYVLYCILYRRGSCSRIQNIIHGVCIWTSKSWCLIFMLCVVVHSVMQVLHACTCPCM